MVALRMTTESLCTHPDSTNPPEGSAGSTTPWIGSPVTRFNFVVSSPGIVRMPLLEVLVPDLELPLRRCSSSFFLAAVLLLVGIQLWGTSGDSIVYDECAHIPAGYAALTKADFSINPEHPPFLKILAALPLLFLDCRWPDVPRPWTGEAQWGIGYRFLYRCGNDSARIVFWSRLPMILIAAVFLGSVYWAARSRYGDWGGCIGAILALSCPVLLGHARLVTTDVGVAVFFFLATMAYWRLLRYPTLNSSVLCGLLTGIALISKFSSSLLAFVYPALLLGKVLTDRRGATPLPEGTSTPRWALPTTLLGAAVVACGTIWAGYGFRYLAASDGRPLPWQDMNEAGGLFVATIRVCRNARLLPEAFLYGLSMVREHSRVGHDAYGLGQHSRSGWWWFFPLALLVKLPTSSLLLYTKGVADHLRGRWANLSDSLPLLIPPGIYGAWALISNINIGIRHLLPIFPFLMVMAAGIPIPRPGEGPGRRRLFVLGALLAWGLVEALVWSPHQIGYFNSLSKMWKPGYQLLADSNLDWGQDLTRLKRYMDREGIPSLKLSYFGTASPEALNLRHQVLPGFNQYTLHEPHWPKADHLLPGDLVAVSETNLAGVYLSNKNLYRPLQELKPVATVGSSILIYRLPATWQPMTVGE